MPEGRVKLVVEQPVELPDPPDPEDWEELDEDAAVPRLIPLVHKGAYRHRIESSFSDQSHYDLEKIFAFRWEDWNEKFRSSLWNLLREDHERHEITQAECSAIATFVQWLGTNCGFAFLIETFREAGYYLVPLNHRARRMERPVPVAEVKPPAPPEFMQELLAIEGRWNPEDYDPTISTHEEFLEKIRARERYEEEIEEARIEAEEAVGLDDRYAAPNKSK